MAGTIVPGNHAHSPEPDDGKEGGQGPRRIRKTYRCAGFGESCMAHPQDGQPYPLRHFVRHSPDGFGWGYGGSAPAELARCILIDHLGYTQQAEAERIAAGMAREARAVPLADVDVYGRLIVPDEEAPEPQVAEEAEALAA